MGFDTTVVLAPNKVDRLLQHPRGPLQDRVLFVERRVAPSWAPQRETRRAFRPNPPSRASSSASTLATALLQSAQPQIASP
jgi:hypothetical protein